MLGDRMAAVKAARCKLEIVAILGDDRKANYKLEAVAELEATGEQSDKLDTGYWYLG